MRLSSRQFEEGLDDLFTALCVDTDHDEAKKLLNIQRQSKKKPSQKSKQRKPWTAGAVHIRPISIEDVSRNPFDYLVDQQPKG
jgi:hypothetical protein